MKPLGWSWGPSDKVGSGQETLAFFGCGLMCDHSRRGLSEVGKTLNARTDNTAYYLPPYLFTYLTYFLIIYLLTYLGRQYTMKLHQVRPFIRLIK